MQTRMSIIPQELQQGFEIVEQQRLGLQREISSLSNPQLTFKPSADVWSIQQIVEHLVLSDETLGQVPDVGVVRNEAPMFRILPRAVRRALVLAAFSRDAALPLPSPDVEPTGIVPLKDLWERWAVSRAKMWSALETLGENEMRYSHPVLGPLTAGQMLKLAQVHTAYHARQIKKLREVMGFPS